MDDELQQLESELRQIEPSRPSRELVARVERELAMNSTQRPHASVWWQWMALPVAAAIAFLLVQFSERKTSMSSVLAGNGNTSRIVQPGGVTTPSDDTPLKPVAAENLLVSATDEGLVTLEDGTEARRERLQYVDTITWKNPRTNASLTWRVPREEVRVMPIVFQ